MWRIGHRGACGHAPENTLLSMRKALELGVDGVEFDIQLSRDLEPVVIHDATLDRTTSGKGRVSAHSLKELRRFDAGQGETIPSLRDVFDAVDGRCRLFIELKSRRAAIPALRVIHEYINRHPWSYEQVFICSFNRAHLAAIRRLDPRIRLCALLRNVPVRLAAQPFHDGAWSINPDIRRVNRRLAGDAHKRGLKVIAWTANSAADIDKAKRLGADGIISDFPDRI